MKLLLVLSIQMLSIFGFANSNDELIMGPTKLVCLSWMDLKVEMREQVISEYAMGEINFTQGEWAYHADVIEGKLNVVNLIYKPLELSTQASAQSFPLNSLSTSLNIGSKRATLDCEIRVIESKKLN